MSDATRSAQPFSPECQTGLSVSSQVGNQEFDMLQAAYALERAEDHRYADHQAVQNQCCFMLHVRLASSGLCLLLCLFAPQQLLLSLLEQVELLVTEYAFVQVLQQMDPVSAAVLRCNVGPLA